MADAIYGEDFLEEGVHTARHRMNEHVLIETSSVTSLNALGQLERRVRMVCDGCDTSIYVSVQPVTRADVIIGAIRGAHRK